MSKLSVKTRGNSHSQGKPRVYFSAHPDDFEKYFDAISDELLKYQNCAVYFDKEPSSQRDEEELFLDLSQMQLLVMPVTTKLLTDKNRALDIEFKYAMEHHIPVLPLMQESGLETLFNKKCGDLQFLTKERKDATEISYEDKLEKYLSSVLIGDELAEKVRNAFDAYIFLSYRKKDRKYAQELMRLIHKNEFCRDIAIWYDEFLTPGENFNDSIKDALNKSRLFALAVTPNLVNEQNYVMTTEYPMANAANKDIMPVELVTTDRAALEESYPDIPRCVNGESELSNTLMSILNDIAIKENDSDPQHNFFIGLAYLGGIDVEVDHERAVKLITSAANAGLPEAIEKLVYMYRSGEGVERNYNTAIEWQRKLVKAKKKIYDTEFDQDIYLAYLEALGALGALLYEVGELAQAEIAYEKMKDEAAKRFIHYDGYDRFLHPLAVSCGEIAHMGYLRGDISKAEKYCWDAIYFCEDAADSTEDAALRRELSALYSSLYIICEAQGRFDEAAENCKIALEIRQQLLAEENSVRTRRDVATAYRNLGDLYYNRKKFDEALKQYDEAYKMRKELADELKTAQAYHELSVCFGRLGDTYREGKNFAVAEKCYLSSMNICETIVQTWQSYVAMRDLAAAYNSLGVLRRAMNDLDGALKYYMSAVAKLKAINIGEEMLDLRRNLAVTHGNIGDILNEKGDYPSAREYYLNGQELLEKIAQETGTVEARRELADGYTNLGDISYTLGDSKAACSYYEKAANVYEVLADETKQPKDINALAEAYYTRSLLTEFDAQSPLLRKAYKLWKGLCRKYPDNTQYAEYLAAAESTLSKYGTEVAPAEKVPVKKKSFFGKLLDNFRKR